jgi:hypothetical protein
MTIWACVGLFLLPSLLFVLIRIRSAHRAEQRWARGVYTYTELAERAGHD